MKTAKVLILRLLFWPLELLVQAINLAFSLKTGFQSRKVPKARLKFLLLAPGVLGLFLAGARAGAEETVPWVSAMAGQAETLSLQHGQEEWFRAVLNTPIQAGDNLWLDAGGKAEVFLDADSFVRLDGAASVRFDTLDKTSLDLAQNLGQALYQTGSDTWIYLVTPKLGITLHPNSRVRLNVAEDESAEITTQRGEAEIQGPAGYASVRAGQSLYWPAGGNSYSLSAAPPADEFDRWSDQRDRQIASAAASPAPATQTLPLPVAYDLSFYGFWLDDPVYGWCWRPRVMAVGWAPYRVGHWMWQPGWGWTWISFEPWGWYPYHYGRWVVSGSGWLWVPEPFLAVAWSPALVFWFEGPDWIGWLPIPPRVDIRVVDRNPRMVYKYVEKNNITIVNVNNFNQTNYIRYNRRPPRDFQNLATVAVNPRHEFRHLRNTRDFMTPEPRGWVQPDRQPPRRMAERVPPVWEKGTRPEHGPGAMRPPGERGPGERPETTWQRPLPPGRGQERTAPARPRETERPGRGPGLAAPPGQIKERPAPPSREEKPGKGGEPGREQPGRGPGLAAPPGQIKERPAPSVREERPSAPPAGQVKERPIHPGREQEPAGGRPGSPPGVERPSRPSGQGAPPGRAEPAREPKPSPSPPRKAETRQPETPPAAPSAPPAQPSPGRGESERPGRGPEKAGPPKKGHESRNYFFSPLKAFGEAPSLPALSQSEGARPASERPFVSSAQFSRTEASRGGQAKGRVRK